jgi:acyl carrier protein
MSTNARTEINPTAVPAGSGTHSAESIEAWLTAKLSDLLAIDPGDVDVEEQLSVYGLSSMTGVMLSGDIEDWLGIKLDPTVAWEYPTVRSLAQYLAGEVGGAATSPGGRAEVTT